MISALFTGGAGSAVACDPGRVVGLVVLVAVRVGRTVQADPTRPGPPMQVEVRRSPIEWRAKRSSSRLEVSGRTPPLPVPGARRRPRRPEGGARPGGHTTGEYRTDVSTALPDAAAEFGGATELFERAWYGDRPTGAEENERFRELADRVVERAGS